MSENLALHKAQRQAPLGVAILFVQNLRRAINIFLAVVVVNLGSDFSVWGLGYQELGLIIAIFFLIFSFLQYRKFTFYVKGDNFVIEKGVIRQEKINVPFERIQSVNTRQNAVQRVLNLVGLKIDTAGSTQEEINIHALTRTYAKQLQEFLMEQRYEQQEEGNSQSEELGSESASQTKTDTKGALNLLLRIDILMLMKVGLSQNHLRSGLILFAIVNGYVWQYEEYLLKPLEPYLERTAESFIGSWIVILPIAFLLFLIISVLSSLVTTVLKYYDFKFYLGTQGLSMESGLIARNSFHVPFSKVQYLVWEANPLQHFFRYKTLRIKQAGAEAVNAKKLIGIPGLGARSLLRVLNTKYPDRKSSPYTYYTPNILMLFQRFSWFGLIPTLVIAALFYYNQLEWPLYLPLLFWPPMVYFFARAYWQRFSLRVNKDYIQIRKGYVFTKRILIPNFKVQNLAIKQSFLQKPRGIASLVLHTAAGSERIPHLDYENCRELYDYLLSQVEMSAEKWM